MVALADLEAIEVEFLTDAHSIIARVGTAGRRLSDIMNFGEDEYMVLSAVQTTSLVRPEDPPITTDFARINKNAVLVALPLDIPPVLDKLKKPRPLEYVAKKRHRIAISLPPFMVTGDLHLVKDMDLRRSRMEGMSLFLPISDARIIYIPDPERTRSSGFAMVNRGRAQILWPSAEV